MIAAKSRPSNLGLELNFFSFAFEQAGIALARFLGIQRTSFGWSAA